MSELAQNVLLQLSLLLGVINYPADQENWQVVKRWGQNNTGVYEFAATNRDLITKCKDKPTSQVVFPSVIHSATRILIDGRLVVSYGDPTFQHTKSFYGAPVLPCSVIGNGGSEIEWQVYSYSKYFARFSQYPTLSSSGPIINFFYETLPIIGAGALFILCLFNLLIFYKKVSNSKLISLVLSNLLTGIYFMGTVLESFGLSVPMLFAHKIADIGIWFGFIFFINLLHLEKIIPKTANYINFIFCFLAILVIAFASDGDTIQLGTTIPFLPVLGITTYAILNLVRRKVLNRKTALQKISLTIFVFTCFNDVAIIIGVSSMMPILPLGIICSYVFILLSINEEIMKTYNQRDELKRLSEDLSVANFELKNAQALVVQKSKLEGLGTLAAGIAHEINNPLNHVYALIKPLRSLTRNLGDEKKQKKIDTALFAMKDCLEMTFSIIHSLKSFTGLNQSEIKEINFSQSIKHILTILKSKTRNIKINLDIPEDLSTLGNHVTINQVMMNLVANACDAIPEGRIGRIDIAAFEKNSRVYFQVKDNGIGISKDHQEKIFDPFFTTKEVGHGMGLGLHICQIELNKMGGNISFTSEKNQGTKFLIALPKVEEMRKSA